MNPHNQQYIFSNFLFLISRPFPIYLNNQYHHMVTKNIIQLFIFDKSSFPYLFEQPISSYGYQKYHGYL
jgi:hypothetical protein